MAAKIQKWGNSQGLRLAKTILEDAGISVGDDVEVVVGKHEIRLTKRSRPKFLLTEMVARMPKGDRTIEEVLGGTVEREEW